MTTGGSDDIAMETGFKGVTNTRVALDSSRDHAYIPQGHGHDVHVTGTGQHMEGVFSLTAMHLDEIISRDHDSSGEMDDEDPDNNGDGLGVFRMSIM